MNLSSRVPACANPLSHSQFAARVVTLAVALGFCGLAAAQTLQVTTRTDEFDGVCNKHCSLRDAIEQANTAGTQVLIRLKEGDYRISRISPADANGYPLDEQDNRSGDFDIRGDILLEGANRDKTRILGGGPENLVASVPTTPGAFTGRVFEVHPGAKLRLSRLQLMRGLSIGDGGAIRNQGEVVLKDVDVHRNGVLVPLGYGQAPTDTQAPGVGGAIANFGKLEVYRSYLVDNVIDAVDHTSTQGSALYNDGSLLMRDSAVAGNRSARIYQDFGGTALYNRGSADIARSWFSHNRSGEDGVIVLTNGGELKLSNSTLFNRQGIRNRRLDEQSPVPSATLIHVTSAGGVFNGARMRVRNSIFAGSPDLFDNDTPEDCITNGEESRFEVLGLVTSTPGGCPATAYEALDKVFTRLLFPRDEGSAANYPLYSLAWARAIAKKGSYLRPRKNGLAVDTAIGSCASHDQLARSRPRDGNGDGVSICDLGAYEY